MGMAIGGSATALATQGVGAANWQKQQHNLKAMLAALQSGDLGSAQAAFASLPGASRLASSNSNAPLAQIGKALQAGDLAGARQAAQSLQAVRGGHQPHRSEQATAPASAVTASGSGGAGSVIHLTS